MAARQRLRTVLDARRASRPCWRCALNLSRYNYTSPAGIQESSNRMDEVPYSQILQLGLEDTLKFHFPDLRPRGVEPAPRTSHQSERGSSQTMSKPRIRIESDGQPVVMRTQSEIMFLATQKPRIRRVRIMSDDQQVVTGTEPPSKSVEATQKPRIWRIQVMPAGQQVTARTEPQSNSMEATQKPRIRMMHDSRPVDLRTRSESIFLPTQKPRIQRIQVMSDRQQVATVTEPQSKSMEATQKPRMRRIQDKSKNQLATLSTRSRSRSKGAVQKPRIRRIRLKSDGQPVALIQLMPDGRPVALGTRDRLRSKKSVQLFIRKYSISHFSKPRKVVPKRVLLRSKRKVELVSRKYSTSPFTKRVLSKSKRKLKKVSSVSIRKYIGKGRLLLREDEALHDELTSLLDGCRVLHTSAVPNPNRETGRSISSKRFPPQGSVIRRVLLSETRTLYRPTLGLANRSFSTRTPRFPNRRYATAVVSKGRLLLIFHTLRPSTESDFADRCPNQPGPHWNKSRGVSQRQIWRHTRSAQIVARATRYCSG